MRRQAWRLVGTFFGCGLSPVAPGTVGSLAAALPLLWLPASHYAAVVAGLAVLATLVGPRAADAEIAATGRKDPQTFVLDEAAGIWIAAWRPENPGMWGIGLAFLLFRLFDITKPWPVRRLESLPGGFGVVYDDVAAGFMALGLGLLIERLWL